MVFQRRGRSSERHGARNRDASTSYWAGDMLSTSSGSQTSLGAPTSPGRRSPAPHHERSMSDQPEVSLGHVPDLSPTSKDGRYQLRAAPSRKRSPEDHIKSSRKRACQSPDRRQVASVVYLPVASYEPKVQPRPSYRLSRRQSPRRQVSVYYNTARHRQHSSPVRRASPRKERRSSPRRHGSPRRERRPSPHRPIPRRKVPRQERHVSPRRDRRLMSRRQAPEPRHQASPSRQVRSINQGLSVSVINKAAPKIAARFQSSHPHGMGSSCPIRTCGKRTRTLRHHAYGAHLPSCFRDSVPASQETAVDMISAIEDLARQILEAGATWTELHQFVLRNSLVPKDTPLRGSCYGHIKELCNIKGWPLPLDSVNLSPDSPACLIHWRILVALLDVTSDGVRNHFRNFGNPLPLPGPSPSVQATQTAELPGPSTRPTPSSAPPNPERLPRGFDTHFHSDRMRSRLHLDAATPLEEVLDKAGQPKEVTINLQKALQIFCDPPTWPQQPIFHQFWKTAVGFHPKNVQAMDPDQLYKLRHLLSSQDVIAFGEIGLDFTVGNWERQGQVLGQLFKLAPSTKPIILHLRGTTADTYQQAPLQECLQIAKAAGVPSTQRFHLHCFSGSFKEVALWTKHFPETWFGYTGMVASFDDQQLSALRFLNAKRFLLETDAPYLWPRPGRRGVNSPRLLGEVAAMVAAARQSTTANILERAYVNARQLYRV
ncbi:uncharacterized protein [Haliotis cracherodii]|uniref:uncharacterized protein n=1 Tax=Haliotis cracherodii TaxID=6455 RepID=UPI0039EBCC1D